MSDETEVRAHVNKISSLSRREFIRLAAYTGALTLAGQSLITIPLTKAKIQAEPGKVSYAMVIDTTRCIGCRACVYACMRENNISSNTQWIEMYEMEAGTPHPTFRHVFRGYPKIREVPTSTSPEVVTPWQWQSNEGRRFMPVQCMHCDNPPCTKVCPIGATYKREDDGIVVTDYDRCIGCRYCMTACPYAARVFNWSRPVIPEERQAPHELLELTGEGPRARKSDVIKRRVGVVEKCTFCQSRIQEGFRPACVVACPVRARHFGNINDPESEVSKLVKSGRCFQLGEELGTKPKIYYVM